MKKILFYQNMYWYEKHWISGSFYHCIDCIEGDLWRYQSDIQVWRIDESCEVSIAKKDRCTNDSVDRRRQISDFSAVDMSGKGLDNDRDNSVYCSCWGDER